MTPVAARQAARGLLLGAALLTGGMAGAQSAGTQSATSSTPTSAGLATLNSEQQNRAVAIERNLRCPLCDNGESISESRADISIQMRASVREQVAQGRSDRAIYDFFAERYGNFVLLDPPREGRGLLLWGAPVLALLLGGAALARVLGGRGRAVPAGAAPVAAPVPEESYDTYLAQVRQDVPGRTSGSPDPDRRQP
ncbi:cytochrome c-type biogenesis protein [uncultured Deinococcus sp.]|uniref:cytochrome c-type biogenesis protein n=1 Tax=uncultured Deinococcus sp. TaxID=158789 RepID=UPI00258D9170|nr:cytochrome c-type biogenesis protein [uncultured Deinococcus sp.]